ncbi:RNA helicase [Theileria orientalis]|uniref:RNA helicase n=1 Tax=Theileria orientalis TaxID=68886 RepID=A0A976M3N1_THEOR|nr:RNA helicase [Theileria orientalis]
MTLYETIELWNNIDSKRNYKSELTCYAEPEYSRESREHKELELKLLREKLFEISEPNCTLEEKYIKASGPGGQKINKSAICDQLIYSNPSGSIKIVIKCKKHRTLMLNRIEATKILISRIEEIKENEIAEMKKENFREAIKNRKLTEKEKNIRMIFKRHRAIKKKARSKIIDESEY